MTLYSIYPTTFMAVISMSRFGEAIQERREVVGYAKQGEAAAASAKLAAEHPEFFQAFSQQWLSRLEADQTGDAIKKAHPLRMMALAYLLKLDSAEFYERVGVAIATVPLRELSPAAAPTRRGPPIPPVVGPLEVTLDIPSELQELIDQYSDKAGFEALKNPKSIQMLALRRAYMGAEDDLQTVDQWLDYFMDMRRWLPK